MNNFNSPAEIAQAMTGVAETKAKLPIYKMLVLGILAGIYIGFGATGFLTVTTNVSGEIAGLGKFLGACVFPVGLMLVVMCGAELFTGNNLMAVGLYNKNINAAQLLKNWLFVYIGNAVGSYLLAFLIYKSGLFSAEAMSANIVKLTVSKTSFDFMTCFVRGVLCNILVTLAVWFATGAKDIVGKAAACFFPIMLFVVCGFEHCVANMFYLPLGQFCGAGVSFADVWLKNILPVTLGNIVGGAVLVSGAYWLCYLKKSK